jgi:hypothetical protein
MLTVLWCGLCYHVVLNVTSTLKMEAIHSSKTLVTSHRAEGHNWHVKALFKSSLFLYKDLYHFEILVFYDKLLAYKYYRLLKNNTFMAIFVWFKYTQVLTWKLMHISSSTLPSYANNSVSPRDTSWKRKFLCNSFRYNLSPFTSLGIGCAHSILQCSQPIYCHKQKGKVYSLGLASSEQWHCQVQWHTGWWHHTCTVA